VIGRIVSERTALVLPLYLISFAIHERQRVHLQFQNHLRAMPHAALFLVTSSSFFFFFFLFLGHSRGTPAGAA
jgi:drug/metabolite transporter (DMT)-like permease